MADDLVQYGDLPYVMSGLPRRRSPYDARRTMAAGMMQGGLDMSPVQHPLQGASRLAQALVGSLMMRGADSEEAAADKARQEAFGKIAGIADPQERIAALGKIDPEAGAKYAGQVAMQEIAAKRKAAEAETAARAFGGGMDPGMGGGQQQAAVPPEQAKAQAMQHAQYLIQNHGFSPEQAAAMVGNLYQESGFNPTAVHDNGTGFGMGGWRLDRRDALLNFAKQAGRDPRDPQTQLDFFATELKGRPEFAQFQQAQTPQERQNALMTYFRPAGWTPQTPQAGHGYGNRVQFAQTFAPGQPPVAQGDNVLPVPRPVADASGNPLPPQGPPRPTEIPRPAPDPELRRRLQQMIATQQMTVADAQRREDDDINRRWSIAVTEAGADRRQAASEAAAAAREAAKVEAERTKKPEAMKKLDTELAATMSAIDNFQKVITEAGGGTLGALINNPRSEEAQKVLGAYETMKAALRSEAFINTGVLQPGEARMLDDMLLSPRSISGYLANPEGYKAKLDEFRKYINAKVSAAQQGYGVPSAVQPAAIAEKPPQAGGQQGGQPQMPTMGSPEEAMRLPKGTRFRDPQGNIRVVP